MKFLTFADAPEAPTLARPARFEERSLLPVAAACVVANATREALSAVFGEPTAVRLFAPSIPTTCGWEAIVASANLYRVRGSAVEATIVLRAPDALALARAAFGEVAPEGAITPAPSPFELRAIGRIVGAVAMSLAGVCGAHERLIPERVDRLGDAQTYFELQIDRPVDARIGIALNREPSGVAAATLTADDLGEVALTLTVMLEVGDIPAACLATLVPGEVLPITDSAGLRGRLRVGERTLARGRCGARNGWYALAIEGHMQEEPGRTP